MKVYKQITDLIGNTPLMELSRYEKEHNLKAKIFAKLEYFNPSGSVKDRVAKAMIEDAEKKGILNKDTIIIEPTSGNTGIGLAAVASSKGYRVILTMPDTMSVERISLLKAYGAKVILTEGSKGMQGAIDKANEIAKQNKNSFIAGQFVNPVNPKVHMETTGPEIYKDTDGQVDIFVAGVGTGGTLTGVGKYLKSKNKNIKIVAVEPADSPLLSKGKFGQHKIQGIGPNFIPEILDTSIYDEVVTITTQDAYATCKSIARTEGLLVGITSGSSVFVATQLAKMPENKDKVIVALLPDNGERYLSTDIFD